MTVSHVDTQLSDLDAPGSGACGKGEVRICALIETLSEQLDLSSEERDEMLPSGRMPLFANRVHWAKAYLKQAGLFAPTRRGHFVITDRGKAALSDRAAIINTAYLKHFDEFLAFQDDDEPKTLP